MTEPALATVYCTCRRTNVYAGRCNMCPPLPAPADADSQANPRIEIKPAPAGAIDDTEPSKTAVAA